MVVFSCNHCGESVKKTAVAKHYQFKCRGAPIFVSCMDCQKDFKGEDYAAHTSCITEAEKYSGKDYVPKPSQNAGQKKQETWVEIVRSILEQDEFQVEPHIRRVFQQLRQYDNVPRKRDKFLNFVSNSLRLPKPKAEPVWKVVEKALEKFKASRPAPPQPSAEKATKPIEAVTESSNGVGSEETASKKTKRKKKEHDEASTAIEAEVAEVSEEPTKKKKKKKHSEEPVTVENSLEETTKSQNEVIEETVEIPKKKKRSKHEENGVSNGEAIVDEQVLQNGHEIAEKVSDKIRKISESEQNGNGHVDSSPSKFDWTNIIYDIIEKSNNEVELEKLKKKVLKKYKKVHQIDEIPWKVEKTFNKKLRKSGLVVADNLVKTRDK